MGGTYNRPPSLAFKGIMRKNSIEGQEYDATAFGSGEPGSCERSGDGLVGGK